MNPKTLALAILLPACDAEDGIGSKGQGPDRFADPDDYEKPLGGDGGGGEGDVHVADDQVEIWVNWTANGVDLDLSYSSFWYFGMAETGNSGGWMEEDCVSGSVCHSFTGSALSLETVTDEEQVERGETTFLDEDVANALTYFVYDIESDDCWVFGDDPDYYLDEVDHCAEL